MSAYNLGLLSYLLLSLRSGWMKQCLMFKIDSKFSVVNPILYIEFSLFLLGWSVCCIVV